MREVDAVVDAEREVGIGERMRLDDARRAARSSGSTSGRYSSPWALSASSCVERGEQRAAVEQVEAGVDLADRELLLASRRRRAFVSTTRSTLPSASRTTRP